MVSAMRSTLLRHSAVLSARSAATPVVRSSISRAAAFHTSSMRSALISPGPQKIEGSVNDPTTFPAPNAAHGSYHWTFERLLAAGLVPLSVAPFAAGSLNPTMDAVLCSAVLLHSHLGFQSCIIDYIPKRSNPGMHKFAWWALNLATVTVGVGLYEFETNDVGVTEAIKRVWKA